MTTSRQQKTLEKYRATWRKAEERWEHAAEKHRSGSETMIRLSIAAQAAWEQYQKKRKEVIG